MGKMGMFDIAILLASIAGLCMVVGGIVLIYKGALVLAATDRANALSIEWKQDFRMSTQVPGLAFFIIGLVFSVVSIYASKPSVTDPVKVDGQVKAVDQHIVIMAKSEFGGLSVDSNGAVMGQVHPNMETIIVEITAPGYEPFAEVYRLSELKNRTISFDHPVQLEKKEEEIVGRQMNILNPPAGVDLPPITASASFGAAQ